MGTDEACSFELDSCSFINNSATYSGGAIMYNLYRPIMTNLTFSGNTATYGSDIASYPIKIIIQNSTSDTVHLENVGSWSAIPRKFGLSTC